MGFVHSKSGTPSGARWCTGYDRLRALLVAGIVGLGILGSARPAFADHSLAYVVRPGDTASDLSQLFGVPLSALSTANPGIDLNILSIGETLIVRPPDLPPPALAPAPGSPGAHHPSFDISPDGIIQRSLTS